MGFRFAVYYTLLDIRPKRHFPEREGGQCKRRQACEFKTRPFPVPWVVAASFQLADSLRQVENLPPQTPSPGIEPYPETYPSRN
jgi:hypothetical protein